MNIAVIIPYYQRSPGILSKALASIEHQTRLDAISCVMVVDDGSPVSAISEIESARTSISPLIKLIEQDNRGVSAARNVALENLGEDIDVVAFLDSDDEWRPNHVELALKAFERGADFYFSNFLHLGSKVGAFERTGCVNNENTCKSETTELLLYTADMVSQIIRRNMIGTSTVACRVELIRRARFDLRYRYAGEDYLMWLTIVQSNPVIMLSPEITCDYGSGVNIFSGAEWGTVHLAKRQVDEIRFRKQLLKKIPFSRADRKHIRSVVYKTRAMFFRNMLSLVRRNPSGFFEALRYYSGSP
jgi:succinoglycan biosynthesis protein ExoW